MAQKNWPGTQQSDTYQNTSDMKPVQPPREGMQFAQETDYFDVRFNNKWNNPLVTDNQFNHESATAGEGQFGDRQFASNRSDLQSTGYGDNMGLNEIPCGTGAAFDRASTVYVDNSRADRGKSE